MKTNSLRQPLGIAACVALLLASFTACNQPQGTGRRQHMEYTNPTIATIMERKSVREYLDVPVEEDRIELLLRAGMAAPTGRGLRPWELVVVQDTALLHQMAQGLPYAKMLNGTRQAIVVCGDSAQSGYWYLDCAAATQNILLAAESLGLGAVWTAAYPYPDRMQVVSQALGLPSHILPLCVIPLGYPSAPNTPKDKYEPQKVHHNKFGVR